MIEELRESWQREEVRSISRRYFISNGFDGTLTATGVAVGSFLSGVPDGLTVFKVGIGAGIGLATSGVWSVWEIEKAEKLAQLHALEDSMMEDLKNTEVHEKKKQGRIINSLSSGLGPVIGVLVPILPFLLERGGLLTMLQATILSVALAVLLLGAFGAYMARISRQKMLWAAARMGLAGLVVALLNIVLPG
ncbi:MAG: VIT1/CCC1 transporter family protein [Candidatus Nanohalobium sp.]